MREILLDPTIKPGRVFVYRGFDRDSCKHPYGDLPEDFWSESFPPGRSAAMVLPPAMSDVSACGTELRI
jgi:hypothetical protein